ncbi:hypothetical protein KGF54_005393 [Candida jiufengensis]|uniref:uncharacterized protein n=1 Tax=Candida jiufengensis TaxID=497108 RepID=UPI00222542DE|nr:uncharacterized protein KGF54_005393 [Candida jiufengensis]KAI5949915.1 hypothetical protein KGF54_005393 [Candida jiufengensis]
MTLLDEQLKRIEDGTKLLQSYYFQDQGMFTNSIINETPTSFLQDSTPDERQLYKVVYKSYNQNGQKQSNNYYDINPNGEDPVIERVDGKSIYKEIVPEDEESEEEYDSEYNNNYDKPMVRVPELYNSDINDSNSKSNSFFSINFSSRNLQDQIKELIQTVDEYPDLILNYQSLKEKCGILKQNYITSMNEIEEIEDEIVVLEDALQENHNKNVLNIDELLQMEEDEIENLQHALEDRS